MMNPKIFSLLRLLSSPVLVSVLNTITVQALDITVTKVTCDQNLPIHALDGGIAVTCNAEERCALGEEVTLRGECEFA